MDYEKKYKESLEMAKSLHSLLKDSEDYKNYSYVEGLEDIFPELAENEDEKMRKLTIHHLDRAYQNCKFDEYKKEIEKCITWLEKQGEQKPFDYENANIQQKDFAPKSAMEAIKEEKVDNANKVEPTFKIGDKIIEKDFDECGCGTIIDIKDGKYIFDNGGFIYIEEQGFWKLVGQKSVNKVEPKFKIGDWVVDNCGYVWKIEGIRNQFYILEGMYGGESRNTIEWVNRTFHLWDITRDAKDGDVLVNGSNIFIFHFINDTRLMGYCHVNTVDGRFYDDIGKNECFCLIDAVVNPATKEQRHTLFTKMHEAGYEWDVVKSIEWVDMDTLEAHCYDCCLFDNGCKDISLCKRPTNTYKGFYREKK